MKLNSVFFRFISAIYLKSFFIIFFALVGFFVGVDLLINFKDLPNSANLILLYVLFLACMAVSYVLPLSLVFALVLCIVLKRSTLDIKKLFEGKVFKLKNFHRLYLFIEAFKPLNVDEFIIVF